MATVPNAGALGNSGDGVHPDYSVGNFWCIPILVGAAAVAGVHANGESVGRLAAWAALGFLATGLLLIAYLHVAGAKEYDPVEAFVSDYARDRVFGNAMRWAFVCLGWTPMLLGSVLIGGMATLPVGWLLICGGACITLLSRFTTRSQERIACFSGGALHDIFVSVGFLLVMVTMGLLGFWQRLGPEWVRAVALAHLNVSGVAVLGEVIVISRFRVKGDKPGQGLAERAVIFLLLTWAGILCWLILSFAGLK